MSFSFGLSAIAILWALTAKAPRPLRIYFFAQLFNMLLVVVSYGRMGTNGYTAMYAIGLLMIVYAMGEIVWQNVKSWWLLLFSGVFAALLAGATFSAIKQFDAGAWAGLIEGAILTFCGTALAFTVPHSRTPKISATLVILWLSLAFFDFAYAMSVSATSLMNLWFRTFAVIAAMAYLGWKLREVPAS